MLRFEFSDSDLGFSAYLDSRTGERVCYMHTISVDFSAPNLDRGLDFDTAREAGNKYGWDKDTTQAIVAPYDEDTFEQRVYECEVDGCPAPLIDTYRDSITTIDDVDHCETCALDESYVYCTRCENATTDWTTVGADESDDFVGDRCCKDDYTSWCGDCDERYWDNDADQHDHTPDEEDDVSTDCCDAPKMTFALPMPGLEDGATASTGLLANDERVSVTFDRDEIDPNGISKIHDLLYNEVNNTYGYHSRLWREVSIGWRNAGNAYKTDRGAYAKRVRSAVYSATKDLDGFEPVSLAPEFLEKIGQIAREWSAPLTFNVEITRDLNQSARAFAHPESCWWQSYSFSRCSLKSNGGFGLRDFDEQGRVVGRAWVMPFRKASSKSLLPTLSDTPDAYFVFNCYGTLNERNAPRLMAHLTGMEVSTAYIDWSEDRTMYVNGDSGYLLSNDASITGSMLPRDLDRHADLIEMDKIPVEEAEPVSATASTEQVATMLEGGWMMTVHDAIPVEPSADPANTFRVRVTNPEVMSNPEQALPETLLAYPVVGASNLTRLLLRRDDPLATTHRFYESYNNDPTGYVGWNIPTDACERVEVVPAEGIFDSEVAAYDRQVAALREALGMPF